MAAAGLGLMVYCRLWLVLVEPGNPKESVLAYVIVSRPLVGPRFIRRIFLGNGTFAADRYLSGG